MTGEEGYLLFSVPATVPQQIWAKLLSAFSVDGRITGRAVRLHWALVLQPFDMMDEIWESLNPSVGWRLDGDFIWRCWRC